MKKNNIYLITFLLAALFVACQKEEDIPPMPTFDIEANMTIAELLSLYTINNAITFCEIPAGTVVCGTVTSCDREKNCSKYLTIQDETGGIMVVMKNRTLYEKYPVGTKLFVKCGEMVIGHKYQNKQIGLLVDDAITGIPQANENDYLFTDGVVGPEPTPLVVTSRNQIDSTYYNRLVQVENCRLQNGGVDTYCADTTATSRNILLSDSTHLVLRTSGQATFANELLPSGACNLTGILINASRGPQLFIRSLDDVVPRNQAIKRP